MMIYLSMYHLWLDHRFIDDIRNQLIQQQNQQSQKK